MVTRRGFASLAALGAGSVLAAPGLPPSPLPTKPHLRTLSVLPLNAETPAHLLDEPFTSARRMFVRNNGLLPASTDPSGWGLTIDGEACLRPQRFSLAELRTRFETHTYALTIECGGNGRAEFHPPVPGNQWTTGAVSCARWTGVRLSDLLNAVGMTSDAVYLAYYGRDRHLSGDPTKVVISRGVPVAKAQQPETLVAWAMNDAPIPRCMAAPCAWWRAAGRVRSVASGCIVWPSATRCMTDRKWAATPTGCLASLCNQAPRCLRRKCASLRPCQ